MWIPCRACSAFASLHCTAELFVSLFQLQPCLQASGRSAALQLSSARGRQAGMLGMASFMALAGHLTVMRLVGLSSSSLEPATFSSFPNCTLRTEPIGLAGGVGHPVSRISALLLCWCTACAK